VLWLKLFVEATGAFIIALGVASAGSGLARLVVGKQTSDFGVIRLVLARHLALALEFQLGADILATAVAPTWDQIGKLGAIAVLRTALNYFLGREIREEGLPARNETGEFEIVRKPDDEGGEPPN